MAVVFVWRSHNVFRRSFSSVGCESVLFNVALFILLCRYVVPTLGEMNSMRLGLFCFATQCIVIAFSTSPTGIFFSVVFSMISNLVYPSISSLVSKVVVNNKQGEAQGALNGIKALTEGFGPLVFGGLMAVFEG